MTETFVPVKEESWSVYVVLVSRAFSVCRVHVLKGNPPLYWSVCNTDINVKHEVQMFSTIVNLIFIGASLLTHTEEGKC